MRFTYPCISELSSLSTSFVHRASFMKEYSAIRENGTLVHSSHLHAREVFFLFSPRYASWRWISHSCMRDPLEDAIVWALRTLCPYSLVCLCLCVISISATARASFIFRTRGSSFNPAKLTPGLLCFFTVRSVYPHPLSLVYRTLHGIVYQPLSYIPLQSSFSISTQLFVGVWV